METQENLWSSSHWNELLLEDRVKILTSHWKDGSDPLLIRTWSPNFVLSKALAQIVTTIWIRLPLLPVEYHEPQILIAIGNLLGKTVALDATRANSYQATSARICIEMDISKFLPSVISLNGLSQEVIYEQLSFFTESLKHFAPYPKPPLPMSVIVTNTVRSRSLNLRTGKHFLKSDLSLISNTYSLNGIKSGTKSNLTSSKKFHHGGPSLWPARLYHYCSN